MKTIYISLFLYLTISLFGCSNPTGPITGGSNGTLIFSFDSISTVNYPRLDTAVYIYNQNIHKLHATFTMNSIDTFNDEHAYYNIDTFETRWGSFHYYVIHALRSIGSYDIIDSSFSSPDSLKVVCAISPYMPYTSIKNFKLYKIN